MRRPNDVHAATLARLSRLVAIRSLSRAEGELADALAADLAQAGLRVQRSGANLWCEIGDAPRPRLLLNSHLDTVPAGEGWTGDPWTPRLVDGRLIGLGANDAKGCVTAMIEAALSIQRELRSGETLGGTLVLALTAEEEISGNGLATILDSLKPLDAAIVGEPTNLIPMIAQRGLLILKGIARGRSAHPANTPPGSADNAIMTAAEDLLKLRDFNWGPPHPLLGKCHAHVTMINGGIARNVIPDSCEFFLDIRTTPLQPHRHAYERLKRFLCSELHIHSERLVPVETSPEASIVKAVLSALPGYEPAGSPTMSDMVFLAGIPAVKIGPGESPRSHTPDEFVTFKELENGAQTYRRIISEYFALAGRGGHLP
ncbi:MAG TPA: M20/M25/M40 family metallo-hydrolase [Phycisphaerae bacterium]